MMLAALLAVVSSGSTSINVAAVEQAVSDVSGQPAPGCVVGAFRDGETLFVVGTGMADLATNTRLDGDSLLYAASVSKQFTALAAALLVVEGKLDLDTDIRDYLPELPEYKAPVTARMLMYHSSGIRDWLELAQMAGYADSGQVSKKQALDLLFRQKDTNFTPGTDYLYSNGGYLLLAEIVERIAQQPFADFVRDKILLPLGMRHSYVMNGIKPTDARLAHGYILTKTGYEIRDTYPLIGGSGGLIITMNDLARYDYDIERGHKIWTPKIRSILFQEGKLSDGTPVLRKPGSLISAAGLAAGWRRGQYFIEHSGSAEAFRNQYARIPALRLGVATFCNRNDWDAVRKNDDIIGIIVGNIFDKDPMQRRSGLFRSEELDTDYKVQATGDELLVEVKHESDKISKLFLMKRTGDFDYAGEGGAIHFEENADTFTLSTGRARNLLFSRIR